MADSLNFVRPMLMKTELEPTNRDGWVHEPKLDGMRSIAVVSSGRSRIFSRKGRVLNPTFPELAEALAQLPDCTLDGEIVAHDEHGYVSVERLRERWFLSQPALVRRHDLVNPVKYFAFDTLEMRGISLIDRPLLKRKQDLADAVKPSPWIELIQHFDDAVSLFESCRLMRFEGIVSKLATSKYEPGVRTDNWIKIKFRRTDVFQIVGRSLEGYVLYKGNRFVGTVEHGFGRSDIAVLNSLRVLRRGKHTNYFIDRPMVRVEFIEWTTKGTLKAPVFKGFET